VAGGAGSHRCLRLLLDEHFSPKIARRLRGLGHDVIAVKERPELIARSDRAHFASMRDQRRAIVTQDLGDFRPLLEQAINAGEMTYGLICVPSGVRLRRKAIGRLVTALDRLLQENPNDDAAVRRGGEIWLRVGPIGRRACPSIVSASARLR
jgi:Domain of unknown function (DUF5615)